MISRKSCLGGFNNGGLKISGVGRKTVNHANVSVGDDLSGLIPDYVGRWLSCAVGRSAWVY